MNYLAHLYLSAPDEDLIVGGFLGDFVKGPLRGDHPQSIERGIQLHRRIDALTDAHPAQKHIRASLPDHFSRFSGIVADLMCDHFLATQWRVFHESSLETFSHQCFETINAQEPQLPETASAVLKRMQRGNWLTHYRDIDYVAESLKYIGGRIRFANPLHECPHFLPAVRDQIESDCLEILNDLSKAVTKWRQKNIPEVVL